MIGRIIKTMPLMALGLLAGESQAQGISRSTGLGIRGSFWRVNHQAMSIRVDSRDNSSSVDLAGLGGSLVFFSRLHENWFLESTLGIVGRVHVKDGGLSAGNVDVSAMIPFTIGMRYDLLSGRIQSSIQPYLCGGFGNYWFLNTAVESEGSSDASVGMNSDFQFGGYGGFGMFLTLTSWFALNFDARYHFVDFSTRNVNSGFEFGLGLCFIWGQKREAFKVQGVKVIVEDIYPAYYRFYNTYPLAMATVENTADFPIEVNLRSWINGITDGVRQSGFVSIPRGESRDIPVYLLFGSDLLREETREPAVIDLEIEARAGVILHKSFSAQVVVHSRNAWNGEIDKLPVFVTPDDSVIQAFDRGILKQDTSQLRPELREFNQARLLFDALSKLGIRYQSDPNIPFDRDDRVQFGSATLSLGTGDCDDLSVLAASILESVGIHTAFVDVRDPEASQGHVYLLFDSGLAPESGPLLSSNEKKYVIRADSAGKSSIWIPLETTLIRSGFETAWKEGASRYVEEGIIRQGLAEGWVKVIDVQ